MEQQAIYCWLWTIYIKVIREAGEISHRDKWHNLNSVYTQELIVLLWPGKQINLCFDLFSIV
jgi:hypothetical protein